MVTWKAIPWRSLWARCQNLAGQRPENPQKAVYNQDYIEKPGAKPCHRVRSGASEKGKEKASPGKAMARYDYGVAKALKLHLGANTWWSDSRNVA